MKTGPKPRPAVERFWSNVVKKADGCWVYADRSDAYGQLFDDAGRKWTAHRFSYTIKHGPIADGLVVRHKCDVRGCVNPEHLCLGTIQENVRDMVERGRAARNTGRRAMKPRRGIYKHGRALSPLDRERLVQQYATGRFTQVELARQYRMSQAAVSATIRGWPGRKENGGATRAGSFRAKLTPELREEVRARYAAGGVTQTQLAEQYHVTQPYISDIISDRRRKKMRQPVENQTVTT